MSKLQFLINISITGKFRPTTEQTVLLATERFLSVRGKIYPAATRYSSMSFLILDAQTK